MEIKEEFKNLIPALSVEEYAQLEANILEEGIREPIITWNGYIIDGHNRFSIAQRFDLEYKTTSKHFSSEESVKEWMILNQFGRRNLSNYQRSVLALELEEVFSKKAKENQGKRNDIKQISAESKPIETRNELSKVASVSHDTISKVKKIQEKAPEEVKAKLATGEVSINAAYKEIKAAEQKDISNKNKLENFDKIEEVKDLRIIQNDSNMFYVSGEKSEKRFGDTFCSVTDKKYNTITTIGRIFHKETGLEFSLREYADVQMFPKDFKFVGNYSSIKKQIGNAVSPFMGAYISKDLKGKTVGDIFAGCGGFTSGLHKNEKKTKWSIEWENIACQSYKLNFPDTKVICANITKVNPLELEKVDIIVGGPPCQGLSNAGSEKRNNKQRFIEDPRNKLYKEFVRFVKSLQPKEFIMENVKEIEQFKDEIIKDFNTAGYDVKTKLVTGNEIGMKQNRKRFFFLGILK
tara:strand:+ start:301 stop:1692 length:1392 start_codon:yes stop_codon:yes gene_type:complete